MRLYAITDRMWLNGKTLMYQVEQALKGGSTCIQLREKNLDDKSFLEESYKIKKLCKKYKVPFIINDNLEIALKCAADGIHIGQNDMEIKKVKKIIEDNMILGVSVETVEQALIAEKEGADYLGVGAVFNTSTKSDANSVSHKTLKDICDNVKIPVVVIGGINKKNMKQLSGIGIDGVALISAIFSVDDIEKECKELLEISIKTVNKEHK
jgi:thiamine-phosphate pyrophosphorylase